MSTHLFLFLFLFLREYNSTERNPNTKSQFFKLQSNVEFKVNEYELKFEMNPSTHKIKLVYSLFDFASSSFNTRWPVTRSTRGRVVAVADFRPHLFISLLPLLPPTRSDGGTILFKSSNNLLGWFHAGQGPTACGAAAPCTQ
ncbi:hypothetical protein DFH06DRAFT_98192 [Mycena polygramma]|nr:hypothetical protein DFH06DRAFT_98192 [Mycena polygramma]